MTRRRTVAVVVGALAAVGLPIMPALVAGDEVPIVCSLPDSAYEVRSLANGALGKMGLPAGAQRVLRFANLSDSHIIDDEASPVITGNATEVALDPTIGNNSAQRLQEEFTDEVLNAMVRTVNVCAGQVAGKGSQQIEFMIATGDLTDNATLNEVRRYIDNLGGTSGHDTAFEANCGYVTHHSTEKPKLGFEGLPCPVPGPALAVPTGRLVPDAQSPTPDPENDPTYAFRPTASARQIAEAAVSGTENGSELVAPGLPPALRCSDGDAACENERLGIPHYAAFGNHDGYPRGTVTFQQPFQAGSLAFGRYFLESQREFINEYFFSTAVNPGHGFDLVRDHDPARWNDDDDRNDGYYAFEAPGGIRIVVLNTIADGVIEEVHGDGQVVTATGGHLTGNEVTNPVGLEMGVMDPEQFTWLQGQLDAADQAGKPVLVFSHHPDNSFSETRLGQPANGPTGVTAEALNEELGARGNTIGWIAGHTHRNRVRPCNPNDCEIGGGFAANPAHAFWRVETASLVDYPQESRFVEVYALDGGGHGLRLTMVRPDPNDPVSNRALELSEAEENCSTAAMLGGPMSSGPYDQSRLQTVAGNLEDAVVNGDFCAGDVANDPNGPQGTPLDRDVLLLP